MVNETRVGLENDNKILLMLVGLYDGHNQQLITSFLFHLCDQGIKFPLQISPSLSPDDAFLLSFLPNI